MSRRANVIRHGANHACGGSDPIPGICNLPPDQGAGDWAITVMSFAATRDLRGFWRLGEGASPFADTSGFSSPTIAADYTDMNAAGTTPPLTLDVTPGLLPAWQDDGGVGFNAQGGGIGTNRPALTPTFAGGGSAVDFAGNHAMSAAAWVQPYVATNTFQGGVLAFVADLTTFSVGWALEVVYAPPAPCAVGFRRMSGSGSDVLAQSSGVAVLTTAPNFIAATYDGTTIRLYLNGVLVDSTVDSTSMASASSYFGLYIGGYPWHASPVFTPWQPFYGVIDEVTVWGDELSSDDVTALYLAGSGVGDGWVLVSDGDGGMEWRPPTIDSGSALAGQVPVADGSGGTMFDYPNHRFYVNGVDP